MIDIINSGKYNSTYIITCRKCGCKFTYNYSDTEAIKGYYSESRQIECPECKLANEATLVKYEKEEMV